MDSCEIYKSGVESERPVLTTRNPAEVISIPKRFIGAWRLSDPSGVTIFGWHLVKKLNLAVPPLTGIPFLQWLPSTYKHVSMWITHTYITGKTLPGLISIQGHAPWPPPFPLLMCVVGFITTLATHERAVLRNHLWALQCLAIRVKGIQMAVNNMHEIHKFTKEMHPQSRRDGERDLLTFCALLRVCWQK